MLSSVLSLLAIFSLPLVNAGSSCISMDASWNLLAFNLNGKDYNVGTQDKWSSGSPSEITASGRPPFSGSNVSCYLSQFSNAIYVLGADSSNPTNIYIYDAAGKSWSTQQVSGASGFDPASLTAILDHDTNVFYGLSKGELFSLAMGDTAKTASSSALSWQDVSKPTFSTDNYQPVMALAENHIHFLNVPNVAAGSADIFVIHFSFWQPDAQKYGDFPSTQHGQTASFFLDQGVQKEFAYIPDDGSNTYIINVDTNSTKTLPAPSTKDAQSMYFGSPDSLVQLTSNGAVNFIKYDPNATSTSSNSWSPVQALASAAPPKPSGSGGSGSGSGSGSAGGASSTNKPNAAVHLEPVQLTGLFASFFLLIGSSLVMLFC